MPKGAPNKRYTPEFKKMVVEAMKNEHPGVHAIIQTFGINGHKITERWERTYLEEGAEGQAVERRGHGGTGKPKKPPKEVEEDLLAEVQQPRAENNYPKNLQALVLEDGQLYGRRTGPLLRLPIQQSGSADTWRGRAQVHKVHALCRVLSHCRPPSPDKGLPNGHITVH